MTEKKFTYPCRDYEESIKIGEKFKHDLITNLESNGHVFSDVSVTTMFNALNLTCELFVKVYD